MNEKKFPGYVSKKTKIRRILWNTTYILLFRPAILPFLNSWRIMLLRLFGAKLHPTAVVYASAKIWAPWQLRLDEKACLGPNTIVYNQDMVWLKQGALLSQYSFICTAGHDTSKKSSAQEGLITAAVTLHEWSWVGMHAFISMGVEVGAYSIVGANAGVYADVPSETIVGGNPAKYIKQRLIK